MPIQPTGSVRALALVGPTSAGKTTLLEALLQATGAVDRRVGGEKVGDSSPEARARGHSVELNLAGFDFMGDRYAVVDCPGPWNSAPTSTPPCRPWTWQSWSPSPTRPRPRSCSRRCASWSGWAFRTPSSSTRWTRPAARWPTCWPPWRPFPPPRWWRGRSRPGRAKRSPASSTWRWNAPLSTGRASPRARSTSPRTCATARPRPASTCWSRSPTSTTNCWNSSSPTSPPAATPSSSTWCAR